MRTYITLVIVIIIGIISLWFQESSKQQDDESRPSTERLPDYFMEHFIITQLDKQGRTSYVIKAQKMLHFEEQNYAELDKPDILLNDKDRQFSIQADRAVFEQDRELIHLYDNVVIQRDTGSPQNELSIYTDYLKINTQTQIAETSKLARVETADASLNSMGLMIDNKQGTLLLQSQVKGRYEQAH